MGVAGVLHRLYDDNKLRTWHDLVRWRIVTGVTDLSRLAPAPLQFVTRQLVCMAASQN